MLGQATVPGFNVCAMSELVTFFFLNHSDKTLEKINLKMADLFGFLVSEKPFITSAGFVAFKDCREAEMSWQRGMGENSCLHIQKVVVKHLSVRGQ